MVFREVMLNECNTCYEDMTVLVYKRRASMWFISTSRGLSTLSPLTSS